ncbi:hypothetical protein BASA62_005260 [Batrachochytrium salamandrivorans]|nr:hypothetical protein BASA62_005260 [Batrachochytrium salamandrivorans]
MCTPADEHQGPPVDRTIRSAHILPSVDESSRIESIPVSNSLVGVGSHPSPPLSLPAINLDGNSATIVSHEHGGAHGPEQSWIVPNVDDDDESPQLDERSRQPSNRIRASLARQPSIESFSIHLDEDRTTFLPGQRIDGHVRLSLTHLCKIKLLRVRFTGLIVTHTQKRRNGKSNSNDQQSVVFLFREIFNHIGSTQPNDSPVDLDAADHIFPFSFRVPPTSLPASFLGPYGEIRYEVTCILLPFNSTKRVESIPITIPSTRDVNTPELQEPKTIDLVCGAGRFWWKSGHIDVHASLSRHGFTSEDTASLKIAIVNHSANALVIRDIALKQQVMYKAFTEVQGPRTERIHKINFSERIGATTRKITRLVQFPIPSSSIISPDISTPVLQVTHSIGFKVQSCAPWSRICKVYLPIVIAGFPFTLFDDHLFRRSVDTLPIYEGNGELERRHVEEDVDTSENLDNMNEEMDTPEAGEADLDTSIPTLSNGLSRAAMSPQDDAEGHLRRISSVSGSSEFEVSDSQGLESIPTDAGEQSDEVHFKGKPYMGHVLNSVHQDIAITQIDNDTVLIGPAYSGTTTGSNVPSRHTHPVSRETTSDLDLREPSG